MRVLILGSNGFSGITFSNYLLEKGFSVIGVSQSSFANIKFNPIRFNKNKKKFKFFKLDINKSINKLFKIIERFKVDVVVDFAGQGMVAESWDYPELTFNTNVISKIRFYNFLIKKKYFKKYIKISTPEVYGSTKNLISEQSNHNPSTPYALSHSSIDMYLKMINLHKGFPVIFGRFANFYGPCQKLYRIIPLSIHKAYHKKKIDLHGGGKSKRSFIFSEDFCRAIFLLIKKAKTGEVYHFASDEYLSIKNLVFLIYKKFDLNPKKYIKITKDRVGKDKDYRMSTKKCKKDLKFKCKVSLSEGINETIAWYKKNKSKFTKQEEKFKIK